MLALAVVRQLTQRGQRQEAGRLLQSPRRRRGLDLGLLVVGVESGAQLCCNPSGQDLRGRGELGDPRLTSG